MHLTHSYYPIGKPTKPEWHHWTIEFKDGKYKVTHGVSVEEDEWETYDSTIEKFHAFTLTNPTITPTTYFNERNLHASSKQHRKT